MTLSLYIARRFLWLFLRVAGGLFGLMVMIDIVDQLRRFSGSAISLPEAATLAVMNVPSSMYKVLPLIMILSAITLFMALARSSELVVIRAAGRSGLRFLLAPLATALALGLVSVALLNPLVAATSKRYDALSSGHARGGSVLSLADGGLWLRQGDGSGQVVIHASRANLDGTALYDATFLSFTPQAVPDTRVMARLARLTEGAWRLEGAKRWSLDDANPERSAEDLPDGSTIATDLTADSIRDSFGTPSAIGFWDLPAYIAGLEEAGFSARSHRVWFQMQLALPLFLVAMVLIAAGFTMRHARLARTGPLVLQALLCGFAIYFLRNFGQILGEKGDVPILLAAWSPPLVASLLALGLLLHQEDG
jgi:lipopolysaccharide export system permease protein